MHDISPEAWTDLFLTALFFALAFWGLSLKPAHKKKPYISRENAGCMIASRAFSNKPFPRGWRDFQ